MSQLAGTDLLTAVALAPTEEPASEPAEAMLPPPPAAAPLPATRAAKVVDEAPTEPAETNLVEQLLRAPGAFLDAVDDGDRVARLRALLLVVTLGAGTFGAVVGAHRGGVQMAYAAVKVPLMLLGTMAICAPAFVGMARALGVRLPAREVVTVSLGACARAALVLAGLAPVLWLFEGFLSYHSVALVVAAGCAVAGLAAAGLLVRGLRRGGGGVGAVLAFLAVFAVVGGQSGWLLRPFLVRPQSKEVPFLRPLEGDLVDSVLRSSRSAAGIYDMSREINRRPAPSASPDSECELLDAEGLHQRGPGTRCGEAP